MQFFNGDANDLEDLSGESVFRNSEGEIEARSG